MKTRFVAKIEETERTRTEVHQLEESPYAYVERIWRKQRDGSWKEIKERTGTLGLYTVYCKDDCCGRGQYGEELDIIVSNCRVTFRIKRMVQAIIDAEYQADVRFGKMVGPRVGLYF